MGRRSRGAKGATQAQGAQALILCKSYKRSSCSRDGSGRAGDKTTDILHKKCTKSARQENEKQGPQQTRCGPLFCSLRACRIWSLLLRNSKNRNRLKVEKTRFSRNLQNQKPIVRNLTPGEGQTFVRNLTKVSQATHTVQGYQKSVNPTMTQRAGSADRETHSGITESKKSA